MGAGDHIWLCKINVLYTQKSPDFCSVCELSQEGDKYELSAPNGARMALPYQEETRLGLVTISYFPHPKNWILITPVYPSETHLIGPIFRENLPTDRPEVLAKYGAWATTLGNTIFIFYFYFWN